MSTDSERDIRDRLGGALDTIEPGSAPAGTIIRRGKAIRIRRRAGIAIAAAAVVGLGIAVPGLIRHSPEPPAKPSYHVTVNPPRVEGKRLVFSGSINSRKWRFALHYSGRELVQSGPAGFNAQGPDGGVQGDPASLSGFNEGQLLGAVGPVGKDVARLTVRLPNGTVLDLRPVSWHGERWAGAVVPLRLGLGTLTAYSRHGAEIAHAVPFRGSEYVGWLRPGQRGMPRQRVLIGSGTLAGKRWAETAYAGPWGLCIQDAGNGFCDPPSSTLARGRLVGWRSCGGGPPELGVAQAAATVRRMRLTFSDGSVQRVPAVGIVGRRYFAFGIEKGVRFTGWTAYGADGQRLGSGPGWGFC